jgi:hypothetical protein
MTKAQELTIIKETIERLGPNSYLGPWLNSMLPSLKFDLRNDFPPGMTHEQQVVAVAIDIFKRHNNQSN